MGPGVSDASLRALEVNLPVELHSFSNSAFGAPDASPRASISNEIVEDVIRLSLHFFQDYIEVRGLLDC